MSKTSTPNAVAKARYTALEPIEHDGVRTEPPGVLELTEAQAAPLLALRHIEPEAPDSAEAA